MEPQKEKPLDGKDPLVKLTMPEHYATFVHWAYECTGSHIPWEEMKTYDPVKKFNSRKPDARRAYFEGMEQEFRETNECVDPRYVSTKAAAVFCLMHASEPCSSEKAKHLRTMLGWVGPRMHVRELFLQEGVLSGEEIDQFLDSEEFESIRKAFMLRCCQEPSPEDHGEVAPLKRNADAFLRRIALLLGAKVDAQGDMDVSKASVRAWILRQRQRSRRGK